MLLPAGSLPACALSSGRGGAEARGMRIVESISGQSAVHTDFSQIKGQHAAKRAMEIAAAGSHNLLMLGPPGSGKTMLARALPSILPPSLPLKRPWR